MNRRLFINKSLVLSSGFIINPYNAFSIDGKADLIFIYQNKLKAMHKLGNLKGANSDAEKLDTLVAQQEKTSQKK